MKDFVEVSCTYDSKTGTNNSFIVFHHPCLQGLNLKVLVEKPPTSPRPRFERMSTFFASTSRLTIGTRRFVDVFGTLPKKG